MQKINKYSIEVSFYNLITSKNEVSKTVVDGSPAIIWNENDNSTVTWSYIGIDSEEKRDNDYGVILHHRKAICLC